MKIRIGYVDRAQFDVATLGEPDRIEIEIAGTKYRITETADGLLAVRLDYPLGTLLSVYPQACNGIDVGSMPSAREIDRQEDERERRKGRGRAR